MVLLSNLIVFKKYKQKKNLKQIVLIQNLLILNQLFLTFFY